MARDEHDLLGELRERVFLQQNRYDLKGGGRGGEEEREEEGEEDEEVEEGGGG